jgi:hypothetical protein
MVTQISVSAASAYAHLGGSDLDMPQLAEAPDADQLAPGQFAGRVKDHHVRSTGDRQP